MENQKTIFNEFVTAQTLKKWDKDKAITISNGNKKVGYIKSFSLAPLCSCDRLAPCYNEKKCYYLKMSEYRTTVSKSALKNSYLLQKYPDLVYNQILEQAQTQLFFRWFVGGDVPNAKFFSDFIIKIAKQCPKTSFLLFTKKYSIVNSYLDNGGKIPNNLKIIFSFWKDFRCDNKHNLPVNEFLPKGESPKKGWLQCGGNCQTCGVCGLGCWALQNGDTMYIKEH
jgi:hypothetical protein